MSRLRIFEEEHPDAPLSSISDQAEIARELARIGVGFEQWQATQPVAPGDPPEAIMAAYRDDIDRLVADRGFKTVDVVSIAPDNPSREEMRRKFLEEHFHKEDEVRFFVAGSGPVYPARRWQGLRDQMRTGRPGRGAGFHPALVRHGAGT